MYFPFLRGRQNELLAIRELLAEGLINGYVIPVIEPVKETSTFDITLDQFIENKYELYITINTQVEDFEMTSELLEKLQDSHSVFPALLMEDNNFLSYLPLMKNVQSIVFYKDRQDIQKKKELNKKQIFPNIHFITSNRDQRYFSEEKLGLYHDLFEKQKRNADYDSDNQELFSDDHIFYKKEGFNAFSDYSIVGQEYNTSGFAPRAVAIHLVYFDISEESLMIRHFVSESNDDIANPAGKFAEALEKLVTWYDVNKENERFVELNDSAAIQEFIHLYESRKYPGLGYVKKLSLKHHLEIMDRYLSNQSREEL